MGVPVCSHATSQGTDRHVAKGIKCEACHEANKEIESPNIEQCRTCHDPVKLSEKTSAVKPQNPHNSPHYNTELDCVLCHVQHDQPENYCAQCHTFDFRVK